MPPTNTPEEQQQHPTKSLLRRRMVTFQGGVGAKTRYNGCRAVVSAQTKKQRRGGWVSVCLRSLPPRQDGWKPTGSCRENPISLLEEEEDDDTSGDSDAEENDAEDCNEKTCATVGTYFKWRSNGWIDEHEVLEGDWFPLDDLPEMVLASILSFLPLEQLIPTCHSLAATNRHLHGQIHRIGGSIPVAANLLHLPNASAQFAALLGIAKFGFQLKELHCSVSRFASDLYTLMALVREGFLQTSQLKKLSIKPVAGVLCLPPPLPLLPRHHRRHPMTKFLLNRAPSIESPLSTVDGSIEFNRFVAESFPNLVSLRTYLNAHEELDPGLFETMRNLEFLRIHIAVIGEERTGEERTGDELNNLVARIPNLQHLVLSACPKYSNSPPYWRVASSTLRTINVVGMGKGNFFHQVTCPRLESFVCVPQFYGNGVRPHDPSVDRNMGHGPIFHRGSQREFRMGTTPWFGMQVPADCVVRYDK
mmetsp:Transcript_12495/g.34686  ORF Transcript_12495/g.34686 Transcript_12495/m.34686 type:complete len:476 (-) Transcript_12495:111-1538(-)|eukprot:CAMPEP_0168727312 /NCGR_PEP_ID=MMETSP0724-20121128/5114_1 /TAXON_ID=265536 /ORGANISM="Amphiprora sp., Strain CCMP467" /LENGTH=475 /DNA_ID=CAMNT_0008774143 /DNA_START=328 /DNA_END=1752 /DNA_ORIENTATION=+